MEVKKVLVVGSGLMGSGIAQVCAQAGIDVLLNDAAEDALNKAIKNIEWSVGKFIEKGKLTEEKKTILGRITPINDLSQGKDIDLAIEAVFEQLELKQQIFEKLDQICGPHTLLASNTSAIPISELAAVTHRADKVLGLHFFSPVPMMQAVEVIKGISTADETARIGKSFCAKDRQRAHYGQSGRGRICNQPHQLSFHDRGHGARRTGCRHGRGYRQRAQAGFG